MLRDKINFKNINFIGILMPPFLATCLMQMCFGVMFWNMSFMSILGNSVCFGVIYYLLCAVLGRWVVSFIIVNVLAAVWGAANYFVSLYRGSPVMPWDLTAIETAAAVSSTYDIYPTVYMIISFLILTLLSFLVIKKMGIGFIKPKNRIVYFFACVIFAGYVINPVKLDKFGIKTDVWDQTAAYQQWGALASFLRNTEFLQVQQPENLDFEYLLSILDSYSQNTLQSGQKPNIIAIMNESWADFEEWGNLSLNTDVNEYISNLDNSVWGHTYTSVFGAGTSASEFEFLTGNSMAFLPSGSIPYQQYVLQPTASVAQLLKDNGYETLAFHPGQETSWQRNKAYPLLGFDNFKWDETMNVDAQYLHGYISDSSDFDQIIWEFENRNSDKPLFLFNVTIQNHGAYTDPEYKSNVYLTDMPTAFPMACQYLSLAKQTDEAFKKLVEYFENYPQPTVILMFGDHQPSVETEFLEKAYGVKQSDMTMEEYMNKFRTPYVIWANYPLDIPQDTQDTSLNFLSLELLKYAGITPDEYMQYLYDFRKEIPALTFAGYTDNKSNAYSHLETNDFTDKIGQYQSMQYMRLFGFDQ